MSDELRGGDPAPRYGGAYWLSRFRDFLGWVLKDKSLDQAS